MRIRIIEDDMNDLQKIKDQLLMIAGKMNIQMDLESFSTPDSIPYDKPVDCWLKKPPDCLGVRLSFSGEIMHNNQPSLCIISCVVCKLQRNTRRVLNVTVY